MPAVTDEELVQLPSIFIVLLNWNGRADTLACLNSLKSVRYPSYRVVVVDNGSTDGSVASIRSAFPDIDLLENHKNLGFAGGNNIGIAYALSEGADYVLLLNNDTIVEPGILDALIIAAKSRPHAAAFGAKIYRYDDPTRIWYAGARWDPHRCRFALIGEGLADDPALFGHVEETAYACGCALFVSTQRIREIGLLDEDFFLYFEETEWCYRARRRGYPSIFVPEAKVWHKVSVSFGGERSPLALYFLTRNRLLWASRHAKLRDRLRLYALTAGDLVRRFVSPLVAKHQGSSLAARWWSWRSALADASNRAYLLGVRDFVFRRLGDCPGVVRELGRQWSARRRLTDQVQT